MDIELEQETPVEIGKYLARMKKRMRAETEFDTLKKLKEELLSYYSGQEMSPAVLLERYRKLSFWQKLPSLLRLALLTAAAVTAFHHLLFPTGWLDVAALAVAAAIGVALVWEKPALLFGASRSYLRSFEMELIQTKLWEEHSFHLTPSIQAYWEGDTLQYQEPDREE